VIRIEDLDLDLEVLFQDIYTSRPMSAIGYRQSARLVYVPSADLLIHSLPIKQCHVQEI